MTCYGLSSHVKKYKLPFQFNSHWIHVCIRVCVFGMQTGICIKWNVGECVCLCTKLGATRSTQCHVATNATIYLHFIFKSQFPFQQMLRNAVRLPKFDKGLRPFLAQVSALILA